jgi:hypothetical protein
MAHFVVAQMNGGRYGGASVLSPQGIALTHVIPPSTPYGMGWQAKASGGRTLINHDGGTPNFQTSLFFDPDERVGVFVAANVCGALDVLSSPPGIDFRDGSTVRAMAESVLNMATGYPLPDQGPTHERVYFLYDAMLVVLTGALIASLARIRTRHRRLEQRGVPSAGGFAWRTSATALLHFALPALLLTLALAYPTWRLTLVLYEPDLVLWLVVVAAVMVIKGLLEVQFLWRVFARSQHGRSLQAAY